VAPQTRATATTKKNSNFFYGTVVHFFAAASSSFHPIFLYPPLFLPLLLLYGKPCALANDVVRLHYVAGVHCATVQRGQHLQHAA
jgi:hypothetical protein